MVILTAVIAVAPGTATYGTTGHSPIVHHEREPDGAAGYNDTPATAERVNGFGTDRPRVRIHGSLPTAGTSVDFYAVDVDAGDVVGAAVGGPVGRLSLYGPGGRVVVGSRGNLSALYPAASPLPRGTGAEPVLHHVAARSGRYTLAVADGTGPYEITMAVYRPGPEQDPRGTTQTLFLDLDGARVDTSAFQRFGAVPGVRDLSPLAAFLPRWGLSPADEPAVARVIVATVRDILVRDVIARGAGPKAAVRVLSSADSADPFGAADVSRVVVGGSTAEAVFLVPTIGVAESIDPGNFAQEETALLLLDLLSGAPDDPTAPLGGRASLNHHLTAASDRIQFVGQVLGQLAAHEASHFYGSFHTDAGNGVTNLMDGGPALDPAAAFGVGPDGIGGTADDIALKLGRDAFDPSEAFTGTQDTLNVVAFGLSRGRSQR